MSSTRDECRKKLIEVASARGTIYYSELAQHLGLQNRDPAFSDCLDSIYEDEIKAGCPDLTAVAIAKDTGVGRFNSQGQRARTVKVDAKNQDDLTAYIEELKRVHNYWANAS